MFPRRDSPHTHIRKKGELVALSKRRRPSWIRGHYRPLTSVRAWNFENVDQAAGGGRWDRDKKWPIRPFIQTSSLQHCYYNAHKGDRYAARNRIRNIVPSRQSPTALYKCGIYLFVKRACYVKHLIVLQLHFFSNHFINKFEVIPLL